MSLLAKKSNPVSESICHASCIYHLHPSPVVFGHPIPHLVDILGDLDLFFTSDQSGPACHSGRGFCRLWWSDAGRAGARSAGGARAAPSVWPCCLETVWKVRWLDP